MLDIAYQAIRTGGTAPAILNAANEVCVEAFLNHRIAFTDMPRIILDTLEKVPSQNIDTTEDISEAHIATTRSARNMIS